MLLVKTKIAPSKIHGIGLFADQFISKGTIVWKFVPGFDMKFTQEEIETLPQTAREFLSTYDYVSNRTGYHVLCIDNARFYNHSKTPNTTDIELEGTDEEGGDVAVRDIQVGEEITYDYEMGDADFQQKLNQKK